MREPDKAAQLKEANQWAAANSDAWPREQAQSPAGQSDGSWKFLTAHRRRSASPATVAGRCARPSAMKAKLLFLILFVPFHSFLSLTVLQHGFNPPPGGHSIFFWVFSSVITAPVLLASVMFDPNGERLPKWFQVASVPLNSLIWGMGLLLLVGLIKRWRGSRHEVKR